MTPLLLTLALSVSAAPTDAGTAAKAAAAGAPQKAGRTLTIVFTGDNGGEVAPCG